MVDRLNLLILHDRVLFCTILQAETMTTAEYLKMDEIIKNKFLELLESNKEHSVVYNLFFTLLGSNNGLLNCITNTKEGDSFVQDSCRLAYLGCSQNTYKRKYLSSIMIHRYSSNPGLQKDLNELVRLLSGKTLIQHDEEMERARKLDNLLKY